MTERPPALPAGPAGTQTAGAQGKSPALTSRHMSDASRARLKKRYAAEARFRFYGVAAITLALAMLVLLIGSIAWRGAGALVETWVSFDVYVDPAVVSADDPANPQTNYRKLVYEGFYQQFTPALSRSDQRVAGSLISSGADRFLRNMVVSDPALIGTTVRLRTPAGDDIDQMRKGRIDRSLPQAERKITDRQLALYDQLVADGDIGLGFNSVLFTSTDSNEPELAGIFGALIGSLMTLGVCLVCAVPVGVAAAIYLEEFAPKNRITDFIEVNINNLAAVPSIVFGLLGLTVFLQFFGLPRSAPLVGGLVLALMTLPTVIIASRAAIKSVPPSIRDAALGLGASRLQAVFHHVLPLAMPGMLTGSIIGMAHALGETAPLLMVGMVAFITSVPSSLTDAATILPVQIYLWADRPERMFIERTSAAIMVLLLFLVVMNSAAILLRKKFERRW
ncbi:phosphate ABC transporter permease PstA [Radicibacter daui]|uniref:phosphate ABC transporter permease PstA n=1 Tax=Radicibacter daui TaxID=3064829 RepID=UPI004046E8EB